MHGELADAYCLPDLDDAGKGEQLSPEQAHRADTGEGFFMLWKNNHISGHGNSLTQNPFDAKLFNWVLPQG